VSIDPQFIAQATVNSPPPGIILEAVVAGLLASVACGLGVLPLFLPKVDPAKHRGMGYAVAGGLMFSASVYNLILPGLDMGEHGWQFADVWPIVTGIIVGAGFLAIVEHYLHNLPNPQDLQVGSGSSMLDRWGGRTGLLVFFAMTCHSIPEGVAVGVGYTYDAVGQTLGGLGPTLALAIAIHNIPEGLAVAIPMRSAGASLPRCFMAAFLTSLPQPIAAVPAVLLAWFFQPLMPFLMGFAAGAMIFLIIMELIPEALDLERPTRIAWGFLFGFCGMLIIQVIL
jgi:ZIP family zinc transporter